MCNDKGWVPESCGQKGRLRQEPKPHGQGLSWGRRRRLGGGLCTTVPHRLPLVHMCVFVQEGCAEKESDCKRPKKAKKSRLYPTGNAGRLKSFEWSSNVISDAPREDGPGGNVG